MSEHSKLIFPNTTIKPRTKEAELGINEYDTFQAPTPDYKEQVFYHKLTTNSKGETLACLFNPNLADGMGVYVKYNTNQLPLLAEWKQMGLGEYVVGLEPCNYYAEGRSEARRIGDLPMIKSGETKMFTLEIGVIDNILDLGEVVPDLQFDLQEFKGRVR